MSNKENPREVQASLGQNNITEKGRFRQVGNLIPHLGRSIRGGVDRVKRHWANLTSAAGLLSMAVISPIDLPTRPTEQDNLSVAGITRLDPDEVASRDNFRVLVMGASLEIRQRVAKGLHRISPLDEWKDMTDIYGLDTSPNLGCTRDASNVLVYCDNKAISKARDEAMAKAGLVFHRTIVAVEYPNTNDYGWGGFAAVDSLKSAPSINSYAVVDLPPKLRYLSDELEEAASIVHEVYHTLGYSHALHDATNEDDLMEGAPTHPYFNAKNTEFLRKLKPLLPFNFEMAQVKIGFSLQDTIRPLDTMDVPVHVPAPAGTIWAKLHAKQQEGPDVTLIIGDAATINDMRDGKYKISAPEMGKGNYIWRPGQLVDTKVWFSNKQQMPDWNSVEDWETYGAWPGHREPSYVAKSQFQLPDKSPQSIKPVFPQPGGVIKSGEGIKMQWMSTDSTLYYFRKQVSGDPTFNQDPATATSFVWDNRLHGGQTEPLNSWQTPKLAPGKYYWRMSIAAMAGQKENWGPVWSFDVSPQAVASQRLESATQRNIGYKEPIALNREKRREMEKETRKAAKRIAA